MTMLDKGRIFARESLIRIGNYGIASALQKSAIAIGSFLLPVWGALAGVVISGVLAHYLNKNLSLYMNGLIDRIIA